MKGEGASQSRSPHRLDVGIPLVYVSAFVQFPQLSLVGPGADGWLSKALPRSG